MKRMKIIKIKPMRNIWTKDKRTDTDRDGVPNFRDCQPFNPLRQGILHRKKKILCDNYAACGKFFPEEEAVHRGGEIYCSEPCAIMGQQIRKEEQEYDESMKKAWKKSAKTWDRDIEKAESRCPYCGFKDFKFFRKDKWNSPTDDVYICPRCHRTFLLPEQFDWDMRKMGHPV